MKEKLQAVPTSTPVEKLETLSTVIKNDLKTMLQTVIQNEFSRQKETKQTDAAVSTDDLHTPTSQGAGDSQQTSNSNSITHVKDIYDKKRVSILPLPDRLILIPTESISNSLDDTVPFRSEQMIYCKFTFPIWNIAIINAGVTAFSGVTNLKYYYFHSGKWYKAKEFVGTDGYTLRTFHSFHRMETTEGIYLILYSCFQ